MGPNVNSLLNHGFCGVLNTNGGTEYFSWDILFGGWAPNLFTCQRNQKHTTLQRNPKNDLDI